MSDDRLGDRIRRAFDVEVPPETPLEHIRQRAREHLGETRARSARPRERILTAATSLFYQEGINAVGINRIIGAANVTPMTLYRQFGGKDALVAASLEQWSSQWLHRLAEATYRRGDDPNDRFDGFWDELEAWLAEDDFRGSFIANAATELRSEPNHPAHAVIAYHRTALRQLLEDVAKTAGAYDAAVLAAQLHTLVEGVITAATTEGDPKAALGARDVAHAMVAAASSESSHE